MLRIGITGGIGCGKSTVAAYFANQFDIPVIDADDITRALTQPGEPALQSICEQFGKQVLLENGHLDRSHLREIIFSQPSRKKQLEQLLHPLVKEYIAQWIDGLNTNYCLVVVPLLFESGMDDMVDRILVIDCDPSQQIARVTARDDCEDTQVADIIKSQLPREQKLVRSHDVIDNSRSTEYTKQQINDLHKKYSQLALHTA